MKDGSPEYTRQRCRGGDFNKSVPPLSIALIREAVDTIWMAMAHQTTSYRFARQQNSNDLLKPK
jgi:hypothetical protein